MEADIWNEDTKTSGELYTEGQIFEDHTQWTILQRFGIDYDHINSYTIFIVYGWV